MKDILQNSNGKYTISEKDLFLFVKTEIIIDVIDTYLFLMFSRRLIIEGERDN